MRVVFGALFLLSALLGCLFMIRLGRPNRTEAPTMARLQHGLAVVAVAFDIVVASVSFGVTVPVGVVLGIVAAQDAVFAWRLIVLERTRRTSKEVHLGQDR